MQPDPVEATLMPLAMEAAVSAFCGYGFGYEALSINAATGVMVHVVTIDGQ